MSESARVLRLVARWSCGGLVTGGPVVKVVETDEQVWVVAVSAPLSQARQDLPRARRLPPR